MFQAATVERAAEILNEYIAAGIEGFTFGNPTLRTPEEFELARQLIKAIS
jgi:hypothetical protein